MTWLVGVLIAWATLSSAVCLTVGRAIALADERQVRAPLPEPGVKALAT